MQICFNQYVHSHLSNLQQTFVDKRDGIWYSKDNVLQDELVAVYGTLKQGHNNHYLLASSTFVGRGVTAKKYPMISRGVPFVGDVEGIGYNINVEVYKVSQGTLSALDSLENHRIGMREEKQKFTRAGEYILVGSISMTQ